MNTILRKFVDEPVFDACAALLNQLHIAFNEITRTPVPFNSLYPGQLSKALKEIMGKVEYTYFIGTVDETSLSGEAKVKKSEEVTQEAANGRYAGMMIFAAEIRDGQRLTRTEMATLTRGFNRIASAQPVVLFIKQNDKLALATCERSDYTQQWRDGEKLGRVSLLRDINCQHPHRGHIDILESLGDKAYPTFEELYKHWMQVFSSELLTKKFYSELSDWYAWAVQVARFPNDLNTDDDDDKFNHESCIRLITRLIFVWFLKQKHLIPEEFFDEDYIRDHFIENFDPHDRGNMLYNPGESKYYRLILQNLFFAMLNCPIVAEGKDTANNRRFRGDHQYGIKRDGYNVNNLMRYKSDFMEGGADEFVQMANSSVPFLNGGLFDCLDDKPNKLYYDGFSELDKSLESLYLPDWLFFGEEVGKGIDLSQWYDDAKKRNVSARGIIDILKRYNFTIEENTPLDQEVSLDPELLGKVFENLLAAVNPDTKISARKQTGSFYTPREVVRYIVDESLIAHLMRACDGISEYQLRSLLSYDAKEIVFSEEQTNKIMKALYNCRVLDPACGSGAFPMGVLQQMVHILRQLDPSNVLWRKYMEEKATEQSSYAFAENVDDDLKERLADIAESFNNSINDPDYARKLYIIEHCIFGVDIQPIAVQISKLRFFISLVVDQKPTADAFHNFGIRPLPNLESKFVAANTLVPLKYDGTLVESAPDVSKYKEKLKELNHKIFLAKRNIDKQRLKNGIQEIRKALAQAIERTGFVGRSEAELLSNWDMFDQNASSSYFDSEWMLGIKKDQIDIIIGNPPYNGISENNGVFIRELIEDYKREPGTNEPLKERKLWLQDDYVKFIRFAENNVSKSNHGIVAFINNNSFIDNPTFRGMRWHLLKTFDRIIIVDLHGNARKNNIVGLEEKDENVFNIMQGVSINILVKAKAKSSTVLSKTFYSEICGSRNKKLAILGNTNHSEIGFKEVEPCNPFYFLLPQTRNGIEEYELGFSIPDLMPTCVTGVVTARDCLVIDIDKDCLLKKIEMFVDDTKSDTEVREIFFGKKKSAKYLPGDSRGWKLSVARQRIRDNDHQAYILPLAFRVFDNRYIYYSSDMVDWAREDIYSQVINKDNVCLVVPRQTTKEWRHVFVSDKVANFNYLATGGQNGAGTHFPLYLYKNGVKCPNINQEIKAKIEQRIENLLTPEELFDYIYGVLHSQSYREKYMEFLKIDFPRIPFPKDNNYFQYYSKYGNSLRLLHLFRGLPKGVNYAFFKGMGSNTISKVEYKDNCVFINPNQYFENVPEKAWNAIIGDDKPAERWLKERKGKTLTTEDVEYYKKMIYVLKRTKEITEEML